VSGNPLGRVGVVLLVLDMDGPCTWREPRLHAPLIVTGVEARFPLLDLLDMLHVLVGAGLNPFTDLPKARVAS
jgi:hypothetical protein